MELNPHVGSKGLIKTRGRGSASGLIQFDLDGTLLNTQQYIYLAMKYTVNKYFHKEVSDTELMSLVGIPLITQMEHFCPEDPQSACDVFRSYQAQLPKEMITVYSGIEKLLDTLYMEGYTLAVVTSKNHTAARNQLSDKGLISYFDKLLGGDEVLYAKPDPYPIIHTAQMLEMPLQRTVYVGDSPFDMQAASRAGVFSVAVDWGIFTQDQLAAEKPDYLVSSPEELLNVIHSLNL